MTALRGRLALLLSAFLFAPVVAEAQSLADIARESKKKKQESTRKVWTNDDLGPNFPEIKLLGTPRQHPPSLGVYEATPMETVRQMLEVAKVRPDEMVFDLGSGDGRIVIMAAEEFGARAVGIEIDKELVALSRRTVVEMGLEGRVKIVQANVLDVDLSPAEVVTLFLSAKGLEQLRPHLEKMLRPGTRVVAYMFQVPGWTPDWWDGDRWRGIYFYEIR